MQNHYVNEELTQLQSVYREKYSTHTYITIWSSKKKSVLTKCSVSFRLTFNKTNKKIASFDVWKKNIGSINAASFNKLYFIIRSCCFYKFFILRSLQVNKQITNNKNSESNLQFLVNNDDIFN